MPKAGYCSECERHVFLTEEGGCPDGHGPESISDEYDAPPPVPGPPPAPDDPARTASGDVLGAILVTLGVMAVTVVAGVAVGVATGSEQTTSTFAMLAAVVVGVFVFFDARSIRRPDITGPALLWGFGVAMLLIVFLPLYVFQRRKFLARADATRAPGVL